MLPPDIERMVNTLAGKYGLWQGPIAMALLTFVGAAAGGRIRLRFSSRTHSLSLPLVLVSPPVAEVTDFLNRLAIVFQDEAHRLTELAKRDEDMIRRERSLRELLNLEGTPVPPTAAEIAAAKSALREIAVLKAHDFLAINTITSDREVFDDHRLVYGNNGFPFPEYVRGDTRQRANIAAALTNGFYDPSHAQPVAVVTQAPRSLIIETVSLWNQGAPSWPAIFVSTAVGFAETIDRAAEAAALQNARTLIAQQLRTRCEELGGVLELGPYASSAINTVTSELAGFSERIAIPSTCSFFIGFVVRMAGILHVLEDGKVPGVISKTSWDRAERIGLWLLHEHMQVLQMEKKDTRQEAAPKLLGRRASHPPTPRDAHFFMAHLARCQPVQWNHFRRRLPKRPPRAWQLIREQLIAHGHVAESAGRLSVVRPIDS